MALRVHGCISRGIASAQLSLCAVGTQLLRTNNSRTVSKQSKGYCLLNSSFIWKPRWDSLRRVPPESPLSGQSHLLPGRCAPSAWLNHPRGSAVTTSTSAILRELWATRPLTHRVCSRGQIGGKWRAAEGLSCVEVNVWHDSDMWQWHVCTLKIVQEKMDVSVSKWHRTVGAVFVMKLLALQFTQMQCIVALVIWISFHNVPCCQIECKTIRNETATYSLYQLCLQRCYDVATHFHSSDVKTLMMM